MDRPIVYDGALPQTTDILNLGKMGMVGQAFQNRAILGSTTVVAGLACLPTSPTPDLHVSVGVGSIYQMDPTDAAAYGDLGVDNNSIMKQGILAAPVTLTITPPGTGGFSQVFLVQAILNDVDAGQLVLSYYNSANPASPFAGPANSGISQFTTRTCPCAIALKAGIAAATGTQVTPAPDLGFVPLYAITVANGATQITSGNIVQQPTAPFFPTLPFVPQGVQQSTWIYGTDIGAVNALVVTFAPPAFVPTAYVAGMAIRVKALVTNTGATTINVNGLGLQAIKRAGGSALVAADITSGQIVELIYDGVNFQMLNYLGVSAGSTTNNFSSVGVPYVVDTGTANALVGTYSPAITAPQVIAGLMLAIKLANAITGATTINVSGLGNKAVKTGDVQDPPNGVFAAGEVLLLVYDGTQYQIVNTSSLTFRKPSANLSIFVNGAIGNDTNDGVSNTSGHALATIQAGITKAFSYAPSQFTITVVVEPGTYNENPITPSYAGPNIIVDGLVAASVIINGGAGTAITVQGPNTMTVKNLTVQGGICGFLASFGAIMTTQNTASNACNIVFEGYQGATVNINGAHTYNGSSQALWYGIFGGVVNLNTAVHTFSTSISVSQAAAVAADCGFIVGTSVSPASFVNAGFVSGPKYLATFNGIISASGLGFSYFPGTIAGSISNGGQYAN